MSEDMKNPLLPRGKTRKSLNRRHHKERRFRLLGLSSILIAVLFLVLLAGSILAKGLSGFITTSIRLPVTFSQELTAQDDTQSLIRQSLKSLFPEAQERAELFEIYGLMSSDAAHQIKALLEKDGSLINTTKEIWLPAASSYDMLNKGKIQRDKTANRRILNDAQIANFDALKAQGRVKTHFNAMFFANADSRQPEQAGIAGGLVGSLFIILCCMALAFPLGVMSAVYLEEFAPKNRLTDVIELNVNNLAAVPSIVFGLLGLTLYLQFFHLPRSASLVGGLTLALMVLPIIIITTRHALKSVPPSIRDAARALGASPIQVVWHHVLPLSLPGIMTGTILSIARALGETAPLLMIGMVAFIADVPHTPLDAATALPVQIFIWSDSPEMGFAEKTAAAIILLLVVLIVINALASRIRRKFETKW